MGHVVEETGTEVWYVGVVCCEITRNGRVERKVGKCKAGRQRRSSEILGVTMGTQQIGVAPQVMVYETFSVICGGWMVVK